MIPVSFLLSFPEACTCLSIGTVSASGFLCLPGFDKATWIFPEDDLIYHMWCGFHTISYTRSSRLLCNIVPSYIKAFKKWTAFETNDQSIWHLKPLKVLHSTILVEGEVQELCGGLLSSSVILLSQSTKSQKTSDHLVCQTVPIVIQNVVAFPRSNGASQPF